jgi:putative sigma-54 modulation protein
MKVSITGHHLPVTDAIRDYVEQKLSRAWRHFGQGLEAQVVLSVERHEQRAEVTVHFQGKDLHAEARHEDLYAAIDLLADKIDRQVVRYKEQHQATVHDGKSIPSGLE